MRALVAAVLLLAASSCASSSNSAHAVEAQVWSPYCPGRLLIDCTTSQARELRGEIGERIAGGDSEQEVIEWVRSEFGDEAIARPEASGFGLVVWLVPAAIFIAGALIVAATIRRRARPHSLNAPVSDQEV